MGSKRVNWDPADIGGKVRKPTSEDSGNEGYSTKGVTVLLEVKDSL